MADKVRPQDVSSAQVKATLPWHGTNNDTGLDVGSDGAEINFMRKGWNGENDEVGSRHDVFGLVTDLDWFSKLVGAQVVEALDASFGNGGSHTVCFAWKGGKYGNVAVVAAANQSGQDMDGVASAAEKNLLGCHDVVVGREKDFDCLKAVVEVLWEDPISFFRSVQVSMFKWDIKKRRGFALIRSGFALAV